MTVLSDIELRRALNALPGWTRSGAVIAKTFEHPTFPAAIAFVNQVADAAEGVQHHPDIDIRYRKVTIALTTHDAGGLTQADTDLAQTIERLASA